MATGDTKYLSKDAWHFQYICKEGQPFYNSLKDDTGITNSATAIVEEDGDRIGEVKTIFPGSDITADDPLY